MDADNGFDEMLGHVTEQAGQAVIAGLHDVEAVFDRVVKDLFGGGSQPAAVSLDDIRWEGMSNEQLAQAVRQLSQGPGTGSMQQAADALANVAQALSRIDQTLRAQLAAIGVTWQSQASDLAQEASTSAAAYGGAVTYQGGQSAAGMNQQVDAYGAAKNAAPDPGSLAGDTPPTMLSGLAAGLTGHGSDHAQEVARTNAARSQAIDAMSNYTTTTQASVGSAGALPVPPGINLHTGTATSVSGFGGGPGVAGLGAPNPGGLPAGLAGGVPVAGGLPGGGLPGGGGVPTGGGSGSPLPPGPVSGVGAGAPTVGGAPGAVPPPGVAAAAGSLMDDAGIGAAIVGGSTAAGVAGATAARDQLVRGRQNNPVAEFADDEFGAGESARQSASALGELESAQTAEARAGERLGAVAEPPPTMLEPAVGARRADDQEHDNRYGTDADDFFADERPVVPDVLDGGTTGEGA